MSDKRKQSKAARELEDTKILVDFLLAHELSFDLLENFSDPMVKQAKHWWKEMNEQFDERMG
jgi:hypothetical protein